MSDEGTSLNERPRRLNSEEIQRLAEHLSAEERQILLHQGTEAPFCGNLLDNHLTGQYICRLCGLPMFSSDDKFNSGTGWPSFTVPVSPENIKELPDDSHGMRRVEIRCARCAGHLGHVFEDGPPPTGRRYCVNSVSLEFVEEGTELPDRLAELD